MAKYEYLDIDEYGEYIVDEAELRIIYKSNMTKGDKNLRAILLALFKDAYNIIKKWRHLNDLDEFLSQKWDSEIIEFVVNSYRRMGDETVASSNINGVSRSYQITPEAKLKSSIPQCI